MSEWVCACVPFIPVQGVVPQISWDGNQASCDTVQDKQYRELASKQVSENII